jgi:hypothetical protein
MGPISSSVVGAVLIKQFIIAVAGTVHLQLVPAAAYICVPLASMGRPATLLCGSLAVSAIGLAVAKRVARTRASAG